jgi:hypothetical protein
MQALFASAATVSWLIVYQAIIALMQPMLPHSFPLDI